MSAYVICILKTVFRGLLFCSYYFIQGHTEWVSCVRFSPSPSAPVIVSAGWDKLVKVWALSNCKLHTNLIGHTGYVKNRYLNGLSLFKNDWKQDQF